MTAEVCSAPCDTGPLAAPLSAGGEAISRSDTRSAGAVSVSNTGQCPLFNGLFARLAVGGNIIFNHYCAFPADTG